MSGFLDPPEARELISDVLLVSGITARLTQVTPAGKSPEEFLEETIDTLFRELDTNKQGQLTLKDLLAPKLHNARSLIQEFEAKLKEFKIDLVRNFP